MRLVNFAVDFVQMARECINEKPGLSKGIFSSRQAQAIVSMGLSRMLRTGEVLDIRDLIDLAVLTSPPEAKKYAELIALRLLVHDEREIVDVFETSRTSEKHDIRDPYKAIIDEDSNYHLEEVAGLSNLIDFLVNRYNDENLVNDAVFQYVNSLETFIWSSPDSIEKLSNVERIKRGQCITAFELLGGRHEVIKRGINSDESLFAEAKNEIIKCIPSIDDKKMAQAEILGYNNLVKEHSRERFVRDIMDILQVANSLKYDEGNEIIDKLDNLTDLQLKTVIRSLNELQTLIERSALELNDAFLKVKRQVMQFMRDKATTIQEVLEMPGLFEDLEYEEWDEFLDNSFDETEPMKSLETVASLDNILGTNLSLRLLERNEKKISDSLTLEDLLNNVILSPEWLGEVRRNIESRIRSAKDYNDFKDISEKLLDFVNKNIKLSVSGIISDYVKHTVNMSIESTIEQEELVELIELYKERNYEYDIHRVKRKGRELGMTETEIAKLLGDLYQYLILMIEEEDPSFERINSLTRNIQFSERQLNELLRLSVQYERSGAMGAFAQNDIRKLIDCLPNGAKGEELLKKALSAGGGENLLYQWYKHSHSLKHPFRKIIKDLAKDIMIDLAKARASALIGSSDAGLLPDGSTRPYYLGDDPDIIDLDETIENIIFSGKRLEDVTWDDLVVRKNVTGRRCVIFLIDISGSMEGEPLACCSLTCAMLLFAFTRDELGVALFESDSHVICEINEDVELNDVVDEILDLFARGGTQMEAALNWAKHQFKLSKSQEKMFIMATDAVLDDFEECIGHLREIADQNVCSVLLMPSTAHGIGNIQDIVETANAQLLIVDDWKKFPELVSKVLSTV